MKDAIRALAACLGAGLIGALLLFAAARWMMPAAVHGPIAEGAWTARSRALFQPSGFYRPELDPQTGRHFSWTTDHAQLEFSNLNRSVAYLVTLEIRHARPAGVPAPVLRVSVDDRLVLNEDTRASGNHVSFEIPRDRRTGAVVTFDLAPMYEPGPPDKRSLGLIVDDVAVAPVRGSFRPTLDVALQAIAAIALCALACRMLGMRGGMFLLAAGGVAIGFDWLLLTDAAFAGTFPHRLLGIGVAAAVTGAVPGAARLRWPERSGGVGWPAIAGVVLAATAVKLGVFWHPLAIVGDGIFQVHRAQAVHAGHYFFTSVTPRPFYEFPYPVALYVAAQPFWNWFATELDLLRLLRTLSIVVDALAGIAIALAARRQWPESRAPLWMAALYPFARAPFEALSNANLTNLFGQGAFSIGLAVVAWLAAGAGISWVAAAFAVACLIVAFLSHFGTFTVGLCVLGVVAAGLGALGRGFTRRAGLWVVGITFVASAVSWMVYYSRPEFREVYAKTYASMSSREADNSSKIDAAPTVKLQRWWSGIGDDYGRPGIAVIAASIAGLFLVWRRAPRQGTTLVFTFWIAAWLALSALGVLSSLTLRANLAAAAAFVVFSGVALSALADRSRAGALAAAALFALIAWDGWQVVLACLRLSGPS
ncbi:MAG TPA: hypothetical protein VFV78_06320 [Vicinamibacterales bacterium]|nr:hypothetical protein [Vicinamibacterales bacterium]